MRELNELEVAGVAGGGLLGALVGGVAGAVVGTLCTAGLGTTVAAVVSAKFGSDIEDFLAR